LLGRSTRNSEMQFTAHIRNRKWRRVKVEKGF
jgi:hypothetical protein